MIDNQEDFYHVGLELIFSFTALFIHGYHDADDAG